MPGPGVRPGRAGALRSTLRAPLPPSPPFIRSSCARCRLRVFGFALSPFLRESARAPRQYCAVGSQRCAHRARSSMGGVRSRSSQPLGSLASGLPAACDPASAPSCLSSRISWTRRRMMSLSHGSTLPRYSFVRLPCPEGLEAEGDRPVVRAPFALTALSLRPAWRAPVACGP
jgi:hypothetical protein